MIGEKGSPTEKIWTRIQDVYSKLSKKEKKDSATLYSKRLIDRLVQRRKILKEYFSTEKDLESYIKRHQNRNLITKRIKAVIASKRSAIDELSKTGGYEKIKESSETFKLYALINKHYVPPHVIFPEIPECPNLCDIKRFTDWFKENTNKFKEEEQKEIIRQIWEAIEENFEDIINKYQVITGRQLILRDAKGLPDFSKFPSLGQLDYWKAPAPSRPAWSNDLYSLEARKMGHKTEVGAVETDSNDSEGEENVTDSATVEASSPLDDDEETQGAKEYIHNECSISKFKLYDTDSFSPLAKPDDPELPDAHKTPRYTFPGTLTRAEDIFYDFALVIPVNSGPECDSFEQPEKRTFNPLAARVLVGKAETIIDFLDWMGLSKVLGHYNDPAKGEQMVKKDVEELLEMVVNLDPNGYSHEQDQQYANVVRELRSQLKAMSGLIRLAARTELYSAAQYDLVEGADKLIKLASEDQFKATLSKQPVPFRTDDEDYYDDTDKNKLWVISHIEGKIDGVTHKGDYPANKLTWWGGPPGAKWGNVDPDQFKYGWWFKLRWDEQGLLRSYLNNLGVIWRGNVEPLAEEAKTFAEKIKELNLGLGGESYEVYKRLAASGIINGALLQLSDLLLEIASQLTLPRQVHKEGDKRLALQVIFRQYWHPEGYVQGKLVGFKNLIPNEKETIKRRTFVKSTRELTTAEEFATARQDDYSHTQKESAEVIKETGNQFNFTSNASGHYDALAYGVEANVGISDTLTHSSKATQNMLSESIMKGSAKYNEKREVKLRELSEVEDVQEVTKELHNANAEITANYFYYQLLRQYRVTVDLHDLRPVLLRTRDVPSPAEIDDQFISTHMHVLINKLPAQLSVDAQESADRIGLLARTMIRQRAEMDDRAAELQAFKKVNQPPGEDEPEKINRYRENVRIREQALSEARQVFIEAEEEYARNRIKMNRVINNLRENITYYMQFIWQDSPKVDQDRILQEEYIETEKLPDVTRGLMRQGYFGNEEIFDYTGSYSIELFQAYLNNLTPGSEILSELMLPIQGEELQAGIEGEQNLAHSYIKLDSGEPFGATTTVNGNPPAEGQDFTVNSRVGSIVFHNALDDTNPTINYSTYEQFAQTALFQYLDRYYHGDFDLIINQIESLAFVTDPVNPEEVLSSRSIQVAQDALVVETMPGQVPLLEGFQMAHRMLDVQKSCLENVHLAERMADKPWTQGGKDDYVVRRNEAVTQPQKGFEEES